MVTFKETMINDENNCKSTVLSFCCQFFALTHLFIDVLAACMMFPVYRLRTCRFRLTTPNRPITVDSYFRRKLVLSPFSPAPSATHPIALSFCLFAMLCIVSIEFRQLCMVGKDDDIVNLHGQLPTSRSLAGWPSIQASCRCPSWAYAVRAAMTVRGTHLISVTRQLGKNRSSLSSSSSSFRLLNSRKQ